MIDILLLSIKVYVAIGILWLLFSILYDPREWHKHLTSNHWGWIILALILFLFTWPAAFRRKPHGP